MRSTRHRPHPSPLAMSKLSNGLSFSSNPGFYKLPVADVSSPTCDWRRWPRGTIAPILPQWTTRIIMTAVTALTTPLIASAITARVGLKWYPPAIVIIIIIIATVAVGSRPGNVRLTESAPAQLNLPVTYSHPGIRSASKWAPAVASLTYVASA